MRCLAGGEFWCLVFSVFCSLDVGQINLSRAVEIGGFLDGKLEEVPHGVLEVRWKNRSIVHNVLLCVLSIDERALLN